MCHAINVSQSDFTGNYLHAPCDGLASHPGGSRNTPSRFMLQKPEISAGLMGLLGSNADFTYLHAAIQVKTRQKQNSTLALMSAIKAISANPA